MANSRWTEEQKIKALTIAEAVSLAEAAKQTGIPRGTIGRWMAETKRNNGIETPETKRDPKTIERLAERAAQEAVVEAKDYIVERLKTLADELYLLAEEGVRETRMFMARPEAKDRDAAAWLRAVVGAMHYGIQDAQLLSGKPTARPEVTNRYEYDITQRIISDPEALDLAENLLRRTADCDPGPLRLDGEQGPLDAI